VSALLWAVIVMWVIGRLTHVGGGLIDLLPVIALVIVVFNVVTRRKIVT